MALLQRLEPRQAFVNRDLCHRFVVGLTSFSLDDDDAIVIEVLSTALPTHI